MKPTTELWENTLSALENTLSGDDFGKWVEGRMSLLRYDRTAGVLYLGVENDFVQANLELKYIEEIERAAQEVFFAPVKVVFLLPDDPRRKPPDRTDDVDIEIIFNPRYTFDNFIIGGNNQFAAKSAQKVAEAPGKAYSPLFIYGGSGLGKTHLMNAIGIYILKNFPRLKVLYVSSETFTDEFVNASLHKNMNVFKAKYRKVDVLLIDDIQFISEKEKTVEEVFHTYEFLYKLGKQMVFTSDRPPKDILGLDERLKGRLGEGLLVDILPPSYETKVAILKKKAELDGVPEDEGLSEVISFISENIKSNVRELESAFNRVVAYAKFTGIAFSQRLAKEILKDVVKMSAGGPSAKDVKKVVANYFNIKVTDIDSDERSRLFSVPRQIAMYLCRELAGLSFPKIAEGFKKDNSTVQHAYKKIREEIGANEQFKEVIGKLSEKLREEY